MLCVLKPAVSNKLNSEGVKTLPLRLGASSSSPVVITRAVLVGTIGKKSKKDSGDKRQNYFTSKGHDYQHRLFQGVIINYCLS